MADTETIGIIIVQASSEHSVCFAVPEKEVNAVSEALRSRFSEALQAGRLSQVSLSNLCFDFLCRQHKSSLRNLIKHIHFDNFFLGSFTILKIAFSFLQIEVIPNCSILAAVGQKMASTPGVSCTLFSALAKVSILHNTVTR